MSALSATSSKRSLVGRRLAAPSGPPVETAPSWDTIKLAARVLVPSANSQDLEAFNHIGQRQRLSYDEFESLMYHICRLIDPKETRRRFKGPRPARDQEGQSRFLETVARFINDKQLVTTRVTSSQLRMFGGENFRRLVGSLLETASQEELKSLARRMPADEQQLLQDHELESPQIRLVMPDDIERLKEVLLAEEEKLKEMREQASQTKVQLSDTKQLVNDKWHNLTRRLRGFTSPRDAKQASAMCTQLLSQLESSSMESKMALEKLRALKIPEESIRFPPQQQAPAQCQNGNGNVKMEKRLSQFIREAKAHLNSADSTGQTNKKAEQEGAEQMRQLLEKHDEQMDSLLKLLRDQAEQADETLLKNPDAVDRFKQLEQLIPSIDLTPITALPHDMEPPTVEQIAKVLAEFTEPGCDNREALEIYGSILSKRQATKI